jgi:putative restriction endonuclease
MKLNSYLSKFQKIRLNKVGDRVRPHKICMLLAVLDLAKAGSLSENRIDLSPDLTERYINFFRASAENDERPNPHYPFFFLRGSLSDGAASFWHLQPIAGRELNLATLQVSKLSDVSNNVDYAYLDPDLFELLQDKLSIEILEDALSKFWFDRTHTDLSSIVQFSSAISKYESHLRQGKLSSQSNQESENIRSPAFRRVVTRNYDYRCAATGIRILIPTTGESMVEAAHIHPFSEDGDDDPRNGLALCPNIHWAMDRNLIAPGPDMLWHVSKVLDMRISDLQMLLSMDGLPLLLPKEHRFWPKEESLVWRIDRLRR